MSDRALVERLADEAEVRRVRALWACSRDAGDWDGTLRGIHDALRPGGHLVFETRDPAYRGWLEWTHAASHRITEIRGIGAVESWFEVIDVSGPLVTFRATYVFTSDGQVLTSDSTLRFRERHEIEADLVAHGYTPRKSAARPTGPGGNWCSLRSSHSEKAAPLKM